MKTIFLDVETYYDSEYSLRRMTPVEYVLDPRFEAIGCAVKEGDGKPRWVEGPDLQSYFASTDPNEVLAVTHNALFDMCVFAWRFNWVPMLMCDTLGVSRAVLGHVLKSHSLANVGNHLGLPAKGNIIHEVKGMGLAAIKSSSLYGAYVEYALNDVTICAGIFDKLVRSGTFPKSELLVMDTVLRCAVVPQLKLDRTVLATHLHDVQTAKNMLLAQAMLSGAEGKKDLMSNQKFADLLAQHGVIPPLKISPVTGLATFAFAKTDPGFIELEGHESPAVQALVAARMGHKSTLEETRTERLISISNLQWPTNEECLIPIPLRYAGAHTHRLSGDWKLNKQNIPRKSPIRRALIPRWPDHTIIAPDASQIEARGVAWICGQTDLTEQFANGEDVYASFASEVFGFPVTKKTHPGERFIGKINILQLGYQSGWETLRNAIRVQSKKETGVEMLVKEDDARHYVTTYRQRYDRIAATWYLLNTTGIHTLAHGGSNFKLGPCKFEQGSILLPSGLRLHYPGLHRDEEEQWEYNYAGTPTKIYGGKLLENIIQALSRIIVMDAAVRLRKRGMNLAVGFNLALQVHDSLGYVVPDDQVDTCKVILSEEMARRPAWAPGWPLASEIYVGKTYGD